MNKKKTDRPNAIRVTLSDEEKLALDYICEDGLTISDAVRLMIVATANGWLHISAEHAEEFNALFDKYVGRK